MTTMLLGRSRGVGRARPAGLSAWTARFALVGTMMLGAGSVHAATFTVANNLDSGDGSLRAAIAQANAAAGADTITFGAGVGSPILLKSALPELSGALTISGPGVTKLTVARDATAQFRIFATAMGSTVTIAGLNIVGGDVSGLAGNDPDENSINSLGGNILNNGGTLTIRECIVFRGKAIVGGGVLNNGGTLNIISTTVTGNTSTEDGTGGGVASVGTLNITNSGITDNEAKDDGGGIFHLSGTMTIENSTISGNECVSGGAGIVTGGSDDPASQLVTRISNSVISNNKSFNSAGGIDSSDGSMTITNTTFTGNTAGSTADNRGSGGAISNRRATLTITGSTFSTNSANNGGAIGNGQGVLSISNSTFSGNSANSGAAIVGGDGAIDIASSTITRNKAGVGAGIFGTARISNSIVSGNEGPDVQGASTSGGYNLIGTIKDGATFTATGDRVGINDPKLGPLSDNGGPTFTHLPPGPAGSPGGGSTRPGTPDRLRAPSAAPPRVARSSTSRGTACKPSPGPALPGSAPCWPAGLPGPDGPGDSASTRADAGVWKRSGPLRGGVLRASPSSPATPAGSGVLAAALWEPATAAASRTPPASVGGTFPAGAAKSVLLRATRSAWTGCAVRGRPGCSAARSGS